MSKIILVSIPLEQGNVFRQYWLNVGLMLPDRLNPFRTGQCLSTWRLAKMATVLAVSIPLEQGNVFRQNIMQNIFNLVVSIPLEQGNVFRPEKVADIALELFVSIPLEQGNVFRLRCGGMRCSM